MFNIEEIRARHEAEIREPNKWTFNRTEAAHADRYTLLRALDAMVEENAELTAVFVAQSGADMRAKQRWQIATGKEGTWPDRANLVVWLLERIEKLEAALDEAKWQPIETAPKDGTRILIWDGHMCPATWSDCCDHGQFETAPGWQIFACEDSWHSVAAYNPTYWMPLPTPPERTHG